jgi:hypothetical protein
MQKIWISKEIENENENEWKIKFLSGLKGQIVRYMLIGGLLTNYPTHIVINPYLPISNYLWLVGWEFLIQNLDEIFQMDEKNDGRFGLVLNLCPKFRK